MVPSRQTGLHIVLFALALGALALEASGSPSPASGDGGTTLRVSVATGGGEGDSYSSLPSISADGRYVAFHSGASNLVAGDTNNVEDVFVHDVQTGVTERVSVDSGGAEGTGASRHPSVSAGGRFVAIHSSATNLVEGDINGQSDIFVRDRELGTTELVSVASDGSLADGTCTAPSISADGRYVAFVGEATNLVEGDINAQSDIFVRDRELGTTERISVASDGSQGNGASDWPGISADGRYVVFMSEASNLVAGDTNEVVDIFVHDRLSGHTERVSVAAGGSQANAPSTAASISADARYVAFTSTASNLVVGDTNGAGDVFVRDLQLKRTERVSVPYFGGEANGWSGNTSISADGRFVAFDSLASNLVAGDTNNTWDIFVHDRQTHLVERVSVASDGNQGNLWSELPGLSADGRYVTFVSEANNLVAGDTNHVLDIFWHVRRTAPPSGALQSYLPLVTGP